MGNSDFKKREQLRRIIQLCFESSDSRKEFSDRYLQKVRIKFRTLGRQSPPKYERSGKINPDIDPFKEVIFEMANVKKFKGSRILEEIRSKGYKAGKTAFYFYFKKIKMDQKQMHFTPNQTVRLNRLSLTGVFILF